MKGVLGKPNLTYPKLTGHVRLVMQIYFKQNFFERTGACAKSLYFIIRKLLKTNVLVSFTTDDWCHFTIKGYRTRFKRWGHIREFDLKWFHRIHLIKKTVIVNIILIFTKVPFLLFF